MLCVRKVALVVSALLVLVVIMIYQNRSLATEERYSEKASALISGGKLMDSVPSYMARIQAANLWRGAGVLVHPEFVLTAAHVIVQIAPFNFEPNTVYKPSGDFNVLVGGDQWRKIKCFMLHPSYKSKSGRDVDPNDLAVCRIERTKNKSHSAMTSQLQKVGTKAFVLGWGADTPGGANTDVLKLANVKIADNGANPPNIIKVTRGSGLSCSGDSGGPLIAPGGVVGVVTHGNCDSEGFYVRLGGKRMQFIMRAMSTMLKSC